MNKNLYLGVATEKITPEIGGQLFGYAPDVFSIGLSDDLTVTAFYFNQGDVKALMLSTTVCLIQTELSDEVRAKIEAECGISAKNIIFSATHTHSGPNVCGMVGWGDIDRPYCDNIFIPSILRAVKAAMENPVAVDMAVTYGDSLVGVNRRQITVKNTIGFGQSPWSPFNPVMTVISFRNVETKALVANMVHYGAHATCAGRDPWISRDWPGTMVDILAEESGAVTAFFNGPEGDVGPRLANGRTTGNGFKAAHIHGAYAGQDAVRIFRQNKAFHAADLSASSAIINLPLAGRMPLETAKAELEKVKDKTVNQEGQYADYLRKTIKSYEDGEEELPTRPVEQTIIKIGDVAFVSFPFELFSEVGMRIARASKVPFVLSLACTNGSKGYFVTEDQICRGGYEVKIFKTDKVQGYADNADWHYVTQTLDHLKQYE